MKAISDCQLYGILDLGYVAAARLDEATREMIVGGVDVIQLRAKNHSLAEIAEWAAMIHRRTQAAGIPFIINDHAGIVRDGYGDGVHVGQDDAAVAAVRELVGREVIVGKSTHSLEQARAAVAEGADYIGFGPLFATPTKPDYKPIGLGWIRQVHEEVRIPIFCIGGIKLENLNEVIAAGARRVVMVSALLKARSIIDYARCATDRLAGMTREEGMTDDE